MQNLFYYYFTFFSYVNFITKNNSLSPQYMNWNLMLRIDFARILKPSTWNGRNMIVCNTFFKKKVKIMWCIATCIECPHVAVSISASKHITICRRFLHIHLPLSKEFNMHELWLVSRDFWLNPTSLTFK